MIWPEAVGEGAFRRDDMDRLTNPAEVKEEVLFELLDLLDAADLAGFPEDLRQALYALRNKMVEDDKACFPGRGRGCSNF